MIRTKIESSKIDRACVEAGAKIWVGGNGRVSASLIDGFTAPPLAGEGPPREHVLRTLLCRNRAPGLCRRLDAPRPLSSGGSGSDRATPRLDIRQGGQVVPRPAWR